MVHRLCSGSTGFFDLDSKFGSFSFDQAKLVDITSDLVVGRGGRLFLLFVSYRVFTSALLRIIESNPVSYKLYMGLVLHPREARNLVPLAKSLYKTPGRRVKLILLLLLLATCYVSISPTIASAMSSYVPISKVFIDAVNEQRVDYSTLMRSLVLENASKIGLRDGTRLGHDNKWYTADGSVNHTIVSTQFQTGNGKEAFPVYLWQVLSSILPVFIGKCHQNCSNKLKFCLPDVTSPNSTLIYDGNSTLDYSLDLLNGMDSNTWVLYPYSCINNY